MRGRRAAAESDLLAWRLRNQKLTQTTLRTPEAVVSWLGAVQSQEYGPAKWGLGLRARGLTEAAVDRAFDEGRILRTHVMRPTWHFVAAADIRWLLALTAPRVHAANAYYYRRAGLEPALLARSRAVIERALEGGRHLTRTQLAAVLERAGISASGERLAYVLMHAELEQGVCSGPRRGRQFTYALLDERAPGARRLDREDALAELTRRFFTSHGPATTRDFAWWSGLTARDAKAGIERVTPALAQHHAGKLTYFFVASRSPAPPAAPTAHLVPIYDEYLIAYKDRELAGAARSAEEAAAAAIDQWGQLLIVDGRFAGTWRRTFEAGTVHVRAAPLRPLSRAHARLLEAAAGDYGRFTERTATFGV